MECARGLFNERGYDATTTSQIAKKASVSERLIYTHFGSKSGLFNAVVVEPFAQVIDGYIDSWLTSSESDTVEERFECWISGVYDLARKHRAALLMALAAHSNGNSAVHADVLDSLARSFQRLLQAPGDEEFAGLDVPAVLVAIVGMVLGGAILDELIIPTGTRRPSRRRIIDEMRTILLDGTRRRMTAHCVG